MNYTVLYVGICLLISLYIFSTLITYWRHASFCKLHECQPAKGLPQYSFLRGFDMILNFQKWLKDGEFMETITRLLVEQGSTFSMRAGGGVVIFTCDPENVKAVLSSKADDFDVPWARIKAFQPVSGDSAFSSKGAIWAHGRALLRPCFSRLQIANFDIYEKNFQKFSRLIPRDGSAVDLQDLFKRFTLDTAAEILFGESVHALDPNGSTKDVGAAFDYASKGVFERSNLGILIFFHWDPKFTRACKVLDAYIEEFVDKAVKFRSAAKSPDLEDGSGKKRYIFLEELAKDTSDRKFLRDQLAGTLAAGRDTTAGLLTNAFWLLARHPQALQTLRTEVAQLGGKLPTYEQLNSMNYLRWVLNETSRMYSVIPLNGRTAERDTFIPRGGGPGGKSPVFVPKGRVVIYSAYTMHRSPDLWGADSTDFRPERWEGQPKLLPKFVPFGGGPRTCPGQQLALIESSYLIVRILQTFPELENFDYTPFREAVAITLTPSQGVLITLRE